MFVLAGEDERLTIIGAWASPRSIGVGGRDKLVRITETESGPAQIAAAGVLVRKPGAGVDQAGNVLARAVETGSTRERAFAIRAALLDVASVRAAIVKAQGDTGRWMRSQTTNSRARRRGLRWWRWANTVGRRFLRWIRTSACGRAYRVRCCAG